MKWLPWRFVVRHLARSKGFLDPFTVLSRLQRFAQPAEVAAPIELLRFAAVLHARGLMNSQAIQHNLDWIWPYWVERQFDPKDRAFIPRAFSLTHINLTHRNWTAVGLPGFDEFPLIDPRGLVTPFYDSWSLDAWVMEEEGENLFPSRLASVTQELLLEDLSVRTQSLSGKSSLISTVKTVLENKIPTCQFRLVGLSEKKAWLVVSLRPCNPEGVSFIHEISFLEDGPGWRVNAKHMIHFDAPTDRTGFSEYHSGDVYRKLPAGSVEEEIKCEVGMATGAALFELKPGSVREITVSVPLIDAERKFVATSWEESLAGYAQLEIPDANFKFLYEAAIRTLILHSPGDVYPGPYTYKHFWFRDAAFIIHAMLAAGLMERAERVLDLFPSRQSPLGYFHSQDGEWDSNGEALWIMQRFCGMSGTKPKASWRGPISRGAHWIKRKRLASHPDSLHAGLFPAGFSAEHLGPNNYYYWDDFWGVTGLLAASWYARAFGDEKEAADFQSEAEDFLRCITKSLNKVSKILGRNAMPASPYRRLDSGAMGSLVAGYPLQLFQSHDPRLLDTVDFLTRECFVKGALFHNMSHSGINPYLTLHIAQVMLRAGNFQFYDLMKSIAGLASPTGQWPEAIHPQTGGGCMGDGQHVWAAAEWIMMMRNMFVREEGNTLVLVSGILPDGCKPGNRLSLGPAPTPWGTISISIEASGDSIFISWKGNWHSGVPIIEVRLPGYPVLPVSASETSVKIPRQVAP